VSLVTPFFNPGPVFEETVTSVLRQSFQQFEWIVVDDGSDDAESLSILRGHAERDARIRVLRGGVRQGPGAARNLGVRSAHAGYVAFLDSDDLLEPTALEEWLWFLECHPQYAMVKGYQAGFGAQGYIWREGFHSGAAILERNIIQSASMVRREVFLAVGGMDESIRGGFEDWDFWLRCANAGYWGGTIPEVLDWYRRRASHNDRWKDWDGGRRQAAFLEELRGRYSRLFAEGFPQPEMSYPTPYNELPGAPAFENRLVHEPDVPRLLVIAPHLVLGGSDKFTLDLIQQLIEGHSFKVTVATTLPSAHDWRHRFEALTPDVFTLDTFLRLRDYPRFLAYLIGSRGIDSVLTTHSQMGYQLLPYLRAQHPGLRCYDYLHIEEPTWKEGGYPAFSLAYAPFLDRTITSSQHLKEWMAERGAESGKISVVTTNIDAEDWRKDRFDINALRKKWRVPPGLPTILFAGRLCEQKQPHVMAGTIRLLRDRGLRFTCLVAGDGEEGAWLRDFASRHQLAELRLLGNRTAEEIRELLAISDIFFLPSRHEGISLAVFEAMAMSVAVVAADVGGQKELVTPECGCLIERTGNETEKYAEALAELLANPSRRREMAALGRQRVVEHFRLDEMGRQMAEILRGRPGAAPFDLGKAFQSFAPGFAREIIEQRRAESIADQLWSQRSIPPSSATGRAAHTGGKASVENLYRSIAMLYPLCGGTIHKDNRKLLFRVLRHGRARRALREAFDPVYYRCSNPDVPKRGPLPLLHYVFYGYREGRWPSPDFDSEAFCRAYPEEPGATSNPLLRKIVLASGEREK
jgi:glycosyltransferase involved in cell wall biosynthesis/GT2 family glycosyltransferase